MKQKHNFFSKIIILLSLFIAGISAYILLTIELPNKPLNGKGESKEFIQKQPIGGEFTLKDHNGNLFHSSQISGKLTLIYFGFTFCPDICPTSLTKLADVVTQLSRYKIPVQVIFISVDPTRDKPNLLKQYLANFHDSFIGLTGSEDEIKKVAELFKVYYAKVDENSHKKAEEHYMMDHSSFVYLMDTNGNYAKHFYMNSTAEEIVSYILANRAI